MPPSDFYTQVKRKFFSSFLGPLGLFVVILYLLIGIYAPLLASSKPLVVHFEGHWYFPLFHYLFYKGFFTKGIDLFFNLLMFTFPIGCALWFSLKNNQRRLALLALMLAHIFLFLWILASPQRDPEASLAPPFEKGIATWQEELRTKSAYAKLNLALRQYLKQKQALAASEEDTIQRLLKTKEAHTSSETARLQYLLDRQEWIKQAAGQIGFIAMPLISYFHWEEDAGGSQEINRRATSWLELTRTTRKDLVAALLFGIRISFVVGFLAVGLALAIGIPFGSIAGYFGGKWDIALSRLLEVWESMPVLFMLLFVVAILQTKSIFVVISVIGLFGWTTIARFARAEFLKQRHLAYADAAKAIGYPTWQIMFSEILPNAIPPILTLLPFAIMSAIMTEAALSFLGLGEEGSSSLGVLMDEGRTAFPAESYLLWPPAILLTILLVSIALVGDSLRDAIDPRNH